MTPLGDGPVTPARAGVGPRALADRCPGLLRPHQAEDGPLVRLRVPGGQTTTAVLRRLSRIAQQFGEGSLQLTSRSNVQLRGLTKGRTADLVEEVAAAGLLPSVTHERVRNIVASPLTGLTGARPDLRPLITRLDTELCATPELARLPGRFLFAVDDGLGDVTALKFDLAYRATGAGVGLVLVGDARHGIDVALAEAPAVLISLALSFLSLRDQLRPRPWHIAELPDVASLDPRIRVLHDVETTGSPVPLGPIGSAASVGVPLSLLHPHQVAAIDAAVSGGPVVITPWRGLLLPGAAASLPALAEAGLVGDDGSVWSQLTACIGAPGCARSLISTRDVASAVADGLTAPPAQPVHISGCGRRCGAPAGRHVDLVAPGSTAAALGEIERAR